LSKVNRPTAVKLPDGIGLFGFSLFWVISAKFIQRDTQGIGKLNSVRHEAIPTPLNVLNGTFWDAGLLD
jgi:cytosine/uracil/thiamine/allantoin permease